MEQIRECVYSHSVILELTPKQVSSVHCPTCCVATRKSCVLHSGAPRSSPHVDRRFAAIEAAERKSGSIAIPDI